MVKELFREKQVRGVIKTMSNNVIMKYFAYSHLPESLQKISKPVGDLANLMDEMLSDSPEKSVGLRKLLEAKDALVRANLP
jgi:hypothetical protein